MPCSQQQAWLMTVYEFTFLKVTASGLFQSATFARVQVKKKKKKEMDTRPTEYISLHILYCKKLFVQSNPILIHLVSVSFFFFCRTLNIRWKLKSACISPTFKSELCLRVKLI